MPAFLTTARLSLRALELSDAPRIEALINDLDIARMLARVPHPYPQGAARDFIEGIRPGQQVFAVCLKDGLLIGCVSFLQEAGKDEGQLGYWLGKAFWGKGYMSEALRAFLRRLFTGGDLNKVTAGVFTDNALSWRMQEKLGFRRTGETPLYSMARGFEAPSWKTELKREEFLKS
jgi:ribosomal-protein-alanine N-acetyltransferase